MKKFDILDQFQATFDGFGNINGFKRVAVVQFDTTEEALDCAKTAFKLKMPMVQPHKEVVVRSNPIRR